MFSKQSLEQQKQYKVLSMRKGIVAERKRAEKCRFESGIYPPKAMAIIRNDPLLWHYAGVVIQNNRNRINRLRKRLARMCSHGQCLFLTMTFNDDVLLLPFDKRRRLVREWLNDNALEYCGNVDYGSNKKYIDSRGNERVATEREHYHAVVLPKGKIPVRTDFGVVMYEKIQDNKKSALKVSKYINKLCFHAIKDSVKGQHLIYSRISKNQT